MAPTHQDDLQPLVVDLGGLARLTGLSPSYLAHNHVTLGIPSIKAGRRRLWPVAAVEEWISKRLEAEAATPARQEVA